MATPTDWHAEYQRLLQRVQYLNGIVGTLGGLAEHWTDQPGNISCKDAGETLLACLEPDQQDKDSGREASTRPRLAAVPDQPAATLDSAN
ncbi:hypothetical protein [Streptomyces decoyicus]|uniref:hypothetical protein n=1 Tax=Streptomyces decoyicus TaxID=249567 RepID=UPI0033B48C47